MDIGFCRLIFIDVSVGRSYLGSGFFCANCGVNFFFQLVIWLYIAYQKHNYHNN